MSDNDKMREVPPITDETYKALMAALGMPNNRSLLSALQQIANHATQRAAWQAAQSAAVPVVGEVVAWRWRYAQKSVEALATACFGKPQWESGKVFDGIPSDEAIQRALLKGVVPEYLYRKPTTSITAAELERLRKDAERLRDALKYYGTHSSACDMSRFISPTGCTCGYDDAIAQGKGE